MTPSVNSLIPKVVPRGITSPGSSWDTGVEAAWVLSWPLGNSFPPLKMEASRAAGSPSCKNPRQPSMHRAVAPTLRAKSLTAFMAVCLFQCFQKAFMAIHPFPGRGLRKTIFFAPGFTVPPGMDFILTIKNAPAQKRQEREFLVCRDDGALAADRLLPILAPSKDSK